LEPVNRGFFHGKIITARSGSVKIIHFIKDVHRVRVILRDGGVEFREKKTVELAKA
jgi:hypothetical protein